MKDIVSDFLFKSNALFTMEASSGDRSFIDFLETQFVDKIVDVVGYEWAVRIEDSIILLTTILFMVGFSFFILLPLTFRGPYQYAVRFSDKLNEVFYMFAEHNGYKELILKKPKNYWERVELIITLFYIGVFGEKRPIKPTNVKIVTIITLVAFFFLFLLMILFLLFTFNVVVYDGIRA